MQGIRGLLGLSFLQRFHCANVPKKSTTRKSYWNVRELEEDVDKERIRLPLASHHYHWY
jgi:hypothetical protein